MRPRNAKYRGVTGCGTSSRSGKPWWIVRTQRACGIGRRCASEIEITGTEENVVKTGWCSGRSSRPCRVVTNGVDWRENSEKG